MKKNAAGRVRRLVVPSYLLRCARKITGKNEKCSSDSLRDFVHAPNPHRTQRQRFDDFDLAEEHKLSMEQPARTLYAASASILVSGSVLRSTEVEPDDSSFQLPPAVTQEVHRKKREDLQAELAKQQRQPLL